MFKLWSVQCKSTKNIHFSLCYYSQGFRKKCLEFLKNSLAATEPTWTKKSHTVSIIATPDDSTKRLPPLMQVTVIDPREKFSTSSSRHSRLTLLRLFFRDRKSPDPFHSRSSNIVSRNPRALPSQKLGLILVFRFRFTISPLIVRHCAIVYGA